MAMVFATWFGAETVLGIPATFLDEDMGGLISDPFGASLCLILFGLFFARPLYRMNLLTIGDFYRNKYNRFVEVMVAIAIALSYLGWVAAQVTALGLVFSVLSDGSITQTQGVIIGASIELNSIAMLAFITGLLTMGFGSIPQQDVFQRANASKNENIAAWGSIGGGIAYFLFAAIPLFLAYSATLIDPQKVAALLSSGNAEHILPNLVIDHLPMYAQVVFYGALLSVIMSTASGTLLAPSVTISENILKGMFGRMSDAHFLRMMRIVVVLFAIGVTAYALWAVGRETGIHHMVENAYKVTLVMAFTPLVAGIYWKRANGQGAVFAILLGLATWIPLEILAPEGDIPPQFAGFIMSIIGMVAGSLLPTLNWLKKR
jgi:Na+/proline symporter